MKFRKWFQFAATLVKNVPSQVIALRSAVCAVTLLACTRTPAQNLLANGSFDAGLASWTIAGPAFISTSSLLVNTSSNVVTVAQTIPTEPGKPYVLTYNFKRFPGAGGTIETRIGGHHLATYTSTTGFPPFDTWTFDLETFIAAETQTDLAFIFNGTGGGFLFDDVKVVQGTPNAPESSISFQTTAVTLQEGSAAEVVLTRRGALDQRASATIGFQPGTTNDLSAASLSDFTLLHSPNSTESPGALPGNIGMTFEPGETTLRIAIRALPDGLDEPVEHGTLALIKTGNASIEAPDQIAFTIESAPSVVQAIDPGPQFESAQPAGILLNPVNGKHGAIHAFTTADGTATPGVDFEPVDLVLPAGNSASMVVPLRIFQDGIIESTETVVLRFESTDGSTVIQPNILTIPILDADVPVITASAPDIISENAGAALISLNRSRGSAEVSFDLTTRDGTALAGDDYQAVHTRVHFAAGETYQSVRIPIRDKPRTQGPRDFSVLLTSAEPSATQLGTPVIPIRIVDTSSPPQVTFDPVNYVAANGPASVATGDWNRDGIPDLACANRLDNSISILLGDGKGGFSQSSAPIPAPGEPFCIRAADVNQDGKLDLVYSARQANSVTVLAGDGAGGFAPGANSTFPVGAEPLSFVLADMNNDGKLDLVCANATGGSVSLLYGNGTGSFTEAPGSPFTAGKIPWDVAVGDLDGDGLLDIVTANEGEGSISVMLATSTGDFRGSSRWGVGQRPFGVALADLNKDGRLEIVVAETGEHRVGVLSITSVHPLSLFQSSSWGTAPYPRSVTIADLNGDGNLDIAVACEGNGDAVPPLGYLSLLLQDDTTGSFSLQTFPAGEHSAWISAGDWDRDGRPDLAIANGTSTNVTVFLNKSLFFRAPAITAESTEVWENAGPARIYARRNFALDQAVSFEIATRDGNTNQPAIARAGEDYDRTVATVTFSPGMFETSFDVPLRNDDWFEGSRSFYVDFQNAGTPYNLPDPITVRINDDDPAVQVFADGNTVRQSEAAGTFQLTLHRTGSESSTRTAHLHYVVEEIPQDSDASSSGIVRARSGVDFQPVSGDLDFGQNVTSRTISIPIYNNAALDGDRHFQLRFTDGLNYANPPIWDLTILDDETQATVSEISLAELGLTSVQQTLLSPDGKRWLLGSAGSEPNSIVERLLPDGSLDPGFGEGGRVIIPAAQYLYLEPAGHLLVQYIDFQGGSGPHSPPPPEFFRADGSVDPSFNLTADLFLDLPDGKSIVVTDNRLWRMLPDYTPDPGFQAWTNLNLAGPSPELRADTQGRLYLQTYAADFGGQHLGHVVRLNPDGTLDSTYHPGMTNDDLTIVGFETDGTLYACFSIAETNQNSITWSYPLVSISPAADFSILGTLESVPDQVISLGDGTFALVGTECFGRGWWWGWNCGQTLQLLRDGVLLPPLLHAETFPSDILVQSNLLSYFQANSLNVSSLPSADPSAVTVGFTATQLIAMESGFSIPLARSGPSTWPVTVHGTIREFPAVTGAEPADSHFTTQIPALFGEATLDLSSFSSPASSPYPREYLVSLDAAEGATIASSKSVHVILIPDAAAGTNKLVIAAPHALSNKDFSYLLLFGDPTAQESLCEILFSQDLTNWNTWASELTVPLGKPCLALPLYTRDLPNAFFRSHRE